MPMKRIDGIFCGAKDDNSLSDGSKAFAPAGCKNVSSYGEHFYVYTSPGSVTRGEMAATVALVPIDVYFNSGRYDHWVLASAASRTEAAAEGYAKVGTLGYGLPLPRGAGG